MAAAAEPEAGAPSEAEDTGLYGSCGGLSTGRKLVPWSSWAEWRFVRDGLFSPYPAAALRRIAAWRSRGSLLIPVDVTASFVEIRMRDPFFRVIAGDEMLESDEMLAMLYSMAIMRLVNGFMENPHKKTGRSISDLAEAVGIPRVLVDIRHESSHRSLPSLRLLRLASIKAFDWLRCIYWDQQTNSIPDPQVELRLRLHEIDHFLKSNDSKRLKSGSKRKRTPESTESGEMEETDCVPENHSSYVLISNSDMKTILLKLSEKEPRLLLSALKSVIEMIEAEEELKNKGESYACLSDDPCKVEKLCSLVLWLVTNIKELKNSGYIGLVHEIGVLSSDKNAVPRFCLAKLLQKLLSLSTVGERCIIDAALLLIEMVNNDSVKEKLRKLPVLSLEWSAKARVMPNEQESIAKATELMGMFRSKLKMQNNACLAENGSEALSNRWSIAKSWTPCPIGTLPCSFSSATVLPAFDVNDVGLENAMVEHHEDLKVEDHPERFDPKPEELEDESMLEVSTPPREHEIPDMPELTSPLKGRLLVGGVWKQMTEEELQFMKSEMKILLQ
ncbi:hypothetical protein PR202_ga09311 [Eleusine coracana subsp. coracana]|uniref:Uncharacterized protein n=1 Tax=Eleusine coracana subsp. coracana TaxID=191504 RepID=A0AAV5C3X5_ELECO|nr:hypothetical protein PR202_ga09311 [Eleusine coracana subsp. coracana]